MVRYGACAKVVARAAAVVVGLSLVSQLALAQPKVDVAQKVAVGGIYELAFNPTTRSLYVAATGQRGDVNPGRIVELDAVTLQAKREYDVSQAPFYGLALNDKTQILYGTATRGGQVAALDLKSGEIVALMGGDNAHVRQVVVDENSNTIYVSIVGTRNPNAENQTPSQLWVIDGASHTLSRRIDVAGAITGLAVDSETGRAYMTDMNANTVVVVDLASGNVVGNWATGGESSINIALDAESDRLFVANQGSGSLSVLNANNGELLHTVATGDGALAVLFNAASNQIYVTNRGAGTTSVVDGATYQVIAHLETGTLPQSLTIDTASNVVYASNKARGQPRNAPADAPPVIDERGDTVARIIQ